MPACKLRFDCETAGATASDQPKSAAKTNEIGISTSFTTTSGKGGTLKALGSSTNVKGFISGYQFGGVDGYDLSTVYTRTNSTAWGFLMVWSGCSNYNDKYIFDGGSNGNHMRFVNSGQLEYRGGGGKAATTTIPVNTSNGGSTAHTFGSGLEVLVVQVNTGAAADMWNVDGDKIASGIQIPGSVASMKIESLFHDGAFSKNPGFMLHEFLTWEGSFSDTEASTIASSYGRYD